MILELAPAGHAEADSVNSGMNRGGFRSRVAASRNGTFTGCCGRAMRQKVLTPKRYLQMMLTKMGGARCENPAEPFAPPSLCQNWRDS